MAKVTLREYQTDWPVQFQAAASELATAYTGVAVQLEHIGSTAVAGLCAKPVIDILLGVSNLNEVEVRTAALEVLGYRYRPEYEAVLPERRYFVRPEGVRLRIHLHAVVHGSRIWQNHLAFRDILRRNADLAQQYAALKRDLATIHANDKAAYTHAKAPFISRVLETVLPI